MLSRLEAGMCDYCLVKMECLCRCWDMHFIFNLKRRSDYRSYSTAQLECAGCEHKLAVEDSIKRKWWRAFFNTTDNELPVAVLARYKPGRVVRGEHDDA